MGKCVLYGLVHDVVSGVYTNHSMTNPAPEQTRIIMIRHGEKPVKGDNLSPQGLKRSLQIPAMIHGKFGVPDHLLVPSLVLDVTTSHSRMFQTATPIAVENNLAINTQYAEKDVADLARFLLAQTGTSLVIWEHHGINDIATAMGITSAPVWADDDFDSIWIVIKQASGTPVLVLDHQGLNAV